MRSNTRDRLILWLGLFLCLGGLVGSFHELFRFRNLIGKLEDNNSHCFPGGNGTFDSSLLGSYNNTSLCFTDQLGCRKTCELLNDWESLQIFFIIAMPLSALSALFLAISLGVEGVSESTPRRVQAPVAGPIIPVTVIRNLEIPGASVPALHNLSSGSFL